MAKKKSLLDEIVRIPKSKEVQQKIEFKKTHIKYLEGLRDLNRESHRSYAYRRRDLIEKIDHYKAELGTLDTEMSTLYERIPKLRDELEVLNKRLAASKVRKKLEAMLQIEIKVKIAEEALANAK